MASALVLIKNIKGLEESYSSKDLLAEGLKRFGIENFELEYGEHGKPYIKGNEIFFNISHSGSYLCCAFSEVEVGLDIEEIGAINLDIAKRFFSDDEYAYIQGKDDKLGAFYSVWTKKEAYTKALGLGMAYKFNTFSVFKEKYIYELEVPGCKMALASKEELEQIKTELL